MNTVSIEIAQLNFFVGAIEYNTQKILDRMQQSQADLIIFPEMSLTGYPLEDLVFRDHLYHQLSNAINQIIQASINSPAVLIGSAAKQEASYFNKAYFIAEGKIIGSYCKQILPNYAVFDEKRYFTSGKENCIVDYKNIRFGILICEDIWEPGPSKQLKSEGADIILSLNASPYHRYKNLIRNDLLKKRTQECGLPFVYCNLVGGQDELVFDGGSSVYDKNGEVMLHSTYFDEATDVLHIRKNDQLTLLPGPISKAPTFNEAIYQALMLGLKDYLRKNHFKRALLGLSGGIDSALTLAIAVDAIGAENIEVVLMPSEYTAKISNEDAIKQATLLGVKYHILPIDDTFSAFKKTLIAIHEPLKSITLENIQPRCRGTLLMAMSNNSGALVLTTGNKSELAVGYSTLYGDMAGGFNVLKDIPKTLVYELAKLRNTKSIIIPERVMTRPPSAELAPGQVDQDSLPPYDILDKIISLSMEKDLSVEVIHQETGIDLEIIQKVTHMIKINEYKRRQAPLGVRITERAFGKDRRYPISSGYY